MQLLPKSVMSLPWPYSTKIDSEERFLGFAYGPPSPFNTLNSSLVCRSILHKTDKFSFLIPALQSEGKLGLFFMAGLIVRWIGIKMTCVVERFGL
ncbi:hypothetical protein DES40_1621 [Litorimonas taeanensis]|uniref:Uncharacterized protein n=1 Tax=Litorimonas taeanensis TaxID=568099 RepID=A0A420WCU9_9PROT|nr:hypothetical protein DES40_1621 [Litorimonas taeanensis]